MIEKAQPDSTIPVKEAIRIARDYVLQIYQDVEVYDVLVEEVQRTEDDRYWLITIGLSHKAVQRSVRGARPPADPEKLDDLIEFTRHRALERDYKLVKIDASTGKVSGMTIRELSAWNNV